MLYGANAMNLTNKKRLVLVGGVAAGASCAARARRLDESAHFDPRTPAKLPTP
jgi:hypothetical protein